MAQGLVITAGGSYPTSRRHQGRARFRERRELVGDRENSEMPCRYLLQFGGDLCGTPGVLRPLDGGELDLQGFMSGFEGLNKGDVS